MKAHLYYTTYPKIVPVYLNLHYPTGIGYYWWQLLPPPPSTQQSLERLPASLLNVLRRIWYDLLRQPSGSATTKKIIANPLQYIISHKLMTYSTNKRAKMASFKDLVSASIEMYDMMLLPPDGGGDKVRGEERIDVCNICWCITYLFHHMHHNIY